MKNVLIFGANGQIGRNLVEQLKSSDDFNPIAFVRKEDQMKDFEDQDVEARLGNLEDSLETIKDLMDDVDRVVFTAGSGGSTDADKTMMIDLDGAIKTMDATKESGIKRYVIVSAFNADDRSKWGENAAYYFAAKHHADRYLQNSGLDYTILRPGMLTNDEGTGKVKVVKEETPEDMDIPRPDVARFILEALRNDDSISKEYDLVGGDTDITEAINQ